MKPNVVTLIIIPVFLFLLSCSSTKQIESPIREMQADKSSSDSTFIISAPLVEKKFVMKNGKELDFTEWYIRRSVQDYFIKFCEGGITRKDLEEALRKQKSTMQPSLTLEIQYKEGSWDICDDNQMQQSRIGKYVIVHRIIEE